MTTTLQLIERCEALCRAHGRDDLVHRLGTTRERWQTSEVRLLVVGEFKQGKSQLVNALVGAAVCPVDDDIATSVPLTVRHAGSPRAALLWAPDGHQGPESVVAQEVPPADLASLLALPPTPPSTAGPAARLTAAEAGLPRKLLATGLSVVDTPGVGGLGSGHGAATRAVLPSAHAVVLVTDASQELTEPELDFLRQAVAACPQVALALTKTDLHPQWRRVAELDRGHLQGAGLDLPLLPVSAQLRLEAARRGDAGLNQESGYPALVRHLNQAVLSRRQDLARSLVRHDVDSVLDSLASSLGSQQRVLRSPDRLPAVMAELEQAQTRARELKARSAKWQQTLADGITDLNSDLDHDLRDRIRTIQAEAEDAIDGGDPGRAWPEFASWLQDRTAGALADTFSWAEQSSGWLVERVGAHFDEAAGAGIPQIAIADTDSLGERIRPIGELDPGGLSLGQKALIGMKGSYGGVLMFGILTGLAGMAMINPISVGAGLLLGGKAYRDDTAARLARRRAEAKTMVRRQLDEVVFQVSKVLRDRLREVQRAVRDHFSQVADDLFRSVGESVQSAQEAARTDAKQRDARLASLREDLATVDRLRSLTAALGRSAPRASADREASR